MKEKRELIMITAMSVFAMIIMAIALIMNTRHSQITSGEVYDKKFEPAYTIERSEMVGYEAPIPQFYTYIYPDRWVIYIRQFSNSNGEYIIGAYYVRNEKIYNSIDIGSMFKYSEDICYPKEPYTKKAIYGNRYIPAKYEHC